MPKRTHDFFGPFAIRVWIANDETIGCNDSSANVADRVGCTQMLLGSTSENYSLSVGVLTGRGDVLPGSVRDRRYRGGQP
jgi:hypothetical protein